MVYSLAILSLNGFTALNKKELASTLIFLSADAN